VPEDGKFAAYNAALGIYELFYFDIMSKFWHYVKTKISFPSKKQTA